MSGWVWDKLHQILQGRFKVETGMQPAFRGLYDCSAGGFCSNLLSGSDPGRIDTLELRRGTKTKKERKAINFICLHLTLLGFG